ncbi:MAG TPA: hypothetical protein VJN70_20800 [Gemmatimonadaceae bacterium]|nr:hypothetical protein [Gemmatimonadaceae bacterium]
METVQPTTAPAPDQQANTIVRILAFLSGAFILILGAPFSLGTSLVGSIAMVIASAIWRRRGRQLSALGHWLAAASGATIVFVLLAGVLTSLSPKGSWSQMTQIADSAQKASAKRPPPAWLERISPGIGARQAAASPPSERVQKVMIALGAALGLFFFVGFFGSLAWGGGMLVGYGVNGHWPGAATRAPTAQYATSL